MSRVALFLLLVSSLVLTYGLDSTNKHDDLLQSPIVTATGCVPLEPVGIVVVGLVQSLHHSCYDNITCAVLLREMEELHNGTRYNFVIGSGMELYIGQGFRCRVYPSWNDLYIKLLWSDDTLEEEIHRLNNIIDEGLKCGHILRNFTVTYSCEEPETQCSKAVRYVSGIMSASHSLHQMPVIGHTIHSPVSETGIILHKDFRWTPCGQASHQARNITKTKVLTPESLPRQRCLPLSSQVDQIQVYFVEAQTNLTCRDQNCENVIGYLEDHHDGIHYNFVISRGANLYIGMGFRCQGYHGDKASLKIKVLAKDETNIRSGTLRLAELIKQGLKCGKVSQNYTVSSYLHINGSFVINRGFNIVVLYFLSDQKFSKEFNFYYRDAPEFDYHNKLEVRYVPWNYKFMACAKDHFTAVTDTGANITTVTSAREETTEEGQQQTPN